MPNKSINAYSRIGLKLLATIGCTELLIMTIFRLIRIETWMSHPLIGLADALLLCVVASFLILYWVVKPMKILEEREKAREAVESVARFPEEDPSPVMRFSYDGTILYANPASLPLRKLWNSELGQKVPVDIANSVMAVCSMGVSKEVEVVCGDTVFSLILACIKNVQYINVYGRDITKRKQAEEEIHKEKAFSEAILDSLPGIFYLFDHTGRFLRWNRTFETISGYSAEEITAMSPLDFFTEDDRALLEERIGKVFETGAAEADAAFLSKDGRRTPHYLVGVRFVLDGVPCCISMGIDITERKHLEAQLLHAQKMEAVGTLAGGVAHDFNNILNVIMGYGAMVMGTLATDSQSRKNMNEVLLAADRAAGLTKRLLVFSRKQVVEVKSVNLNELILGLQKMLVRIIRESIDFHLDLVDRPLIVQADAGQIEQVLINLAANARDAMLEGGRLTIGTGLEDVDEKYVAAYGYGKPGRYALITVADTGQGIDAETQKKIFEPFFTTKGIGEGTGLGLAISYGIIKQHSGYIKVYSEPGHGTVFKIYLPLSETVALPDTKTEGVVPIKGGNETILVAEDDATLRKLTAIILESFGYTVITAEDGEDAITKFLENRDRISLVVLDMIMPKKNGKEVSAAVRKVSPRMGILFVSGYTMEIITNKELTEGGLDFIQKPFPSKDLLAKVREVLDR